MCLSFLYVCFSNVRLILMTEPVKINKNVFLPIFNYYKLKLNTKSNEIKDLKDLLGYLIQNKCKNQLVIWSDLEKYLFSILPRFETLWKQKINIFYSLSLSHNFAKEDGFTWLYEYHKLDELENNHSILRISSNWWNGRQMVTETGR